MIIKQLNLFLLMAILIITRVSFCGENSSVQQICSETMNSYTDDMWNNLHTKSLELTQQGLAKEKQLDCVHFFQDYKSSIGQDCFKSPTYFCWITSILARDKNVIIENKRKQLEFLTQNECHHFPKKDREEFINECLSKN